MFYFAYKRVASFRLEAKLIFSGFKFPLVSMLPTEALNLVTLSKSYSNLVSTVTTCKCLISYLLLKSY